VLIRGDGDRSNVEVRIRLRRGYDATRTARRVQPSRSLVGADQAVGECVEDELCARLQFQLLHDVGAVRLDCANRDEKHRGDLLIPAARPA